MKIDMKRVGSICREYRIKEGYTLKDIAKDMNYSIENISRFERGINDNGRILLWYLFKGMEVEKLL